MKSKAKAATVAEKARMARLKEMPCLCCSTLVNAPLPQDWFRTEVHHLLSGNKRRGHLFTIPLCPWHHRGSTGIHSFVGPFIDKYGLSLAHGSKPFHARFGTDDELLAKTNELLEKHDVSRL